MLPNEFGRLRQGRIQIRPALAGDLDKGRAPAATAADERSDKGNDLPQVEGKIIGTGENEMAARLGISPEQDDKLTPFDKIQG